MFHVVDVPVARRILRWTMEATMDQHHVTQAQWRIEREYLEMPGLSLTEPQTRRLLGLPRDLVRRGAEVDGSTRLPRRNRGRNFPASKPRANGIGRRAARRPLPGRITLVSWLPPLGGSRASVAPFRLKAEATKIVRYFLRSRSSSSRSTAYGENTAVLTGGLWSRGDGCQRLSGRAGPSLQATARRCCPRPCLEASPASPPRCARNARQGPRTGPPLPASTWGAHTGR